MSAGSLPNDYHFITTWHVDGTCGEVADVIGDPLGLPRWWPSVYLDVREIDPSGPRGVGQRVRLHSKGWLPYTIRWEFEVVESRYPLGFTIDASGDFVGRGVWTFTQAGPLVEITYDWRVRAEKPLLRALSPVLKPLFEANHRWAMRQGEASLTLELARRRATDAARAAMPPPPGPVTYSAAALVGGTFAYLLARARRSRRRRR